MKKFVALWHSLRTRVLSWLSHWHIRRHGGRVSWGHVALEFWQRLQRADLLEHAYAAAFNLSLALFPAMIAVFMLIPSFPGIALDQRIATLMQEVFSPYAYELLVPTIQDTLSKPRSGLFSMTFLSTLYLATNGMMSLIKAFDSVYLGNRTLPRTFFVKRGVAVLLTCVLALMLFSALLLLTAGHTIIEWAFLNGWISSSFQVNIISVLRLLIFALILLHGVACIYAFAPSVRKKWPFFSVGTLVATSLIFLASEGFSYYIQNFASYNRVYGSIGVFIALMTWFLMFSAILLVGFELNVSIDARLSQDAQQPVCRSARSPKKKKGE